MPNRTKSPRVRARVRTGERISRDDGPPRCPGCGRVLNLSQPDESDPGRLVGVCGNEDCAQWTCFALAESGAWVVRERLFAPPVTPTDAVA